MQPKNLGRPDPSASVRNSRIIFTPDPRLKDMLKTLN
jgi:hypothetical protein